MKPSATLASRACCFFLFLTACILTLGCARKEYFQFSASSAGTWHQDTSSTAERIKSQEQTATPASPQTPGPSDSQILTASTAEVAPVVFQKPYVRKSLESAVPVPAALARQKDAQPSQQKKRHLVQQEPSPTGEAETKGINTLVILGMVSGFVAVVSGLFGVLSIMGGGWVYIGISLLAGLLGLLFSAFALSKIKKNPERPTYSKDRRAAKLGILLNVVPIVLLLLLLLFLLVAF